MNAGGLLLIAVAAFVGALIGGLLPLVYRRFRPGREAVTAQSAQVDDDQLDPLLVSRINQVSRDWAMGRGHPDAAPLAAGYLVDAARSAQRRWRRSP